MFVNTEWTAKFNKIKLAKSDKKELNCGIKNVSHSIYHRSIQTKRRIFKANIRYTVLTAFFFLNQFHWISMTNTCTVVCVLVEIQQFAKISSNFCFAQWVWVCKMLQSMKNTYTWVSICICLRICISCRVSISHTGLNRHGFHCESSRLYDGVVCVSANAMSVEYAVWAIDARHEHIFVSK